MTLPRLIDNNHVPDFSGELSIFAESASSGVFYAAFTWVFYIALEPFIRRRWSELLISWSRLMAGDFRDPLVGRDILVGGLLGLGGAAVEYLTILLHQWSGIARQPSIEEFTPELLSGVEVMVAHLFFPLSLFMFLTIAISFVLLLLLVVLRKKPLAIAALWLLHLIPWAIYAIYGSWLGLMEGVLIGTLLTLAVARFGLLAFYSYFLFYSVSLNHAITSNFSSWYAKNTLFVFIVLMGLATYGFYTSLAGKRLLKGRLLES